MSRPPRGPVETGRRPEARERLSAATALAAVEDLQGAAADLGWPDATALADALVDALSHLLVDLGAGKPAPTSHPPVVGAIGGPARPLDHASCRTACAALRRAGAALLTGGAPWADEGGRVALDLADLLELCVEQDRAGRLRPATKSVVVRRLRDLQRRLHALS